MLVDEAGERSQFEKLRWDRALAETEYIGIGAAASLVSWTPGDETVVHVGGKWILRRGVEEWGDREARVEVMLGAAFGMLLLLLLLWLVGGPDLFPGVVDSGLVVGN